MLISKKEILTLKIVLFVTFIAWLSIIVTYFDNPMVGEMFSSRFLALFGILWMAVYVGYVSGAHSMERSIDEILEDSEIRRKADTVDKLGALVSKRNSLQQRIVDKLESKE